MAALSLRRFDLNLLLVLETLIETGSTTKAADQLARTQPGVSRDLAKLRRLLGDPLFVKVRGRLQPTERALELRPLIKDALQALEHGLVGRGKFDPAEARQVFHIGANSSIELILASRVHNAFRRVAPGVVVRFSTVFGDVLPLEELEAGRLDLAVGRFETCPSDFNRLPLFRDRRVCLVRKDHPIARKTLSLEKLASLQFLTTSNMLGRDNDLDKLLKARGYRREFPLLISHFALAPYVLLDSDMATTMPGRAAAYLLRQFPLKALQLPAIVPPNTFTMVWHKRWETSRPRAWLRQQVRTLLATQGAD